MTLRKHFGPYFVLMTLFAAGCGGSDEKERAGTGGVSSSGGSSGKGGSPGVPFFQALTRVMRVSS